MIMIGLSLTWSASTGYLQSYHDTLPGLCVVITDIGRSDCESGAADPAVTELLLISMRGPQVESPVDC